MCLSSLGLPVWALVVPCPSDPVHLPVAAEVPCVSPSVRAQVAMTAREDHWHWMLAACVVWERLAARLSSRAELVLPAVGLCTLAAAWATQLAVDL
jgi:hypothetical protein